MASDQDNLYRNRAVEALNKRISSCIDSNERLVLSAKRAVLFARSSYISEAKSSALQLRASNAGYDARLSAWIMFLEGTILHFDNLDNTRSKDKFLRAFLIGQVAHDRELSGLAAAWLAHCEFVAGSVAACIEHLSKAIEWSDVNDHEARGRAFMVAAGICDWIDDPIAAKAYLKLAREHASKSGDLALQNTIIFNSAAYAVARLTLNSCIGIGNAEDKTLARLHVNSAHNLNSALGIDTLKSMIPIMRAEILVSESQWNDAISIFNEHIESFVKDGQERLLGKLFAQRAWCKANLGYRDSAAIDITLSLQTSGESIDLDDLAVLHFRLAGTNQLMGDEVHADEHRRIALSALEELKNQQTKARTAFQKLETLLPKK